MNFPRRIIAVRFAMATAAGLLAGMGLQSWRLSGNPGGSGASAGGPASAATPRPTVPKNASPAWVRELRALDPAEYPPFSIPWQAQFSLAAATAIQNDPRAAMEAFAASPELHKTGCVEVFTALLCENHPLLALELADNLPAVFSETVRTAVPYAMARLDPAKGLELARSGWFPRPDLAGEVVAGAMGKAGDITGLSFLRHSLQGQELEYALKWFAFDFAKVKPAAAVAAATANPGISKWFLQSAGTTYWRDGDVIAALDCLTKMDKADALEQLKSMVQDLYHVPPEALMPAFQRLLALAETNPELMPPAQFQSACHWVSNRLEREPDRLAEFAAVAPEGPIRDELLRVLEAVTAKHRQ